jgi:hypothetical protein
MLAPTQPPVKATSAKVASSQGRVSLLRIFPIHRSLMVYGVIGPRRPIGVAMRADMKVRQNMPIVSP